MFWFLFAYCCFVARTSLLFIKSILAAAIFLPPAVLAAAAAFAFGAILAANGFLLVSIINSNLNLAAPPSMEAPLYLSTAAVANLLDLKTIVANL